LNPELLDGLIALRSLRNAVNEECSMRRAVFFSLMIGLGTSATAQDWWAEAYGGLSLEGE
jgi:hypothetical protein